MASSPFDIFTENISDAEQLVRLVDMLSNGRERRMRAELRERVGEALGFTQRDRDGLDCVESDHLFVILKPGSVAQREQFTEEGLRPLLRQAIVATSAAVESYVADKAGTYVSSALAAEELPPRLNDLQLGMREIVELDRSYTRRGWGYRARLLSYLDEIASPAPSSIGKVFSTVGLKVPWTQVDELRKKAKGTSEKELTALSERRNRIAHAADRQGSTRAPLTLEDAERFLEQAREIVQALEQVLPHG